MNRSRCRLGCRFLVPKEPCIKCRPESAGGKGGALLGERAQTCAWPIFLPSFATGQQRCGLWLPSPKQLSVTRVFIVRQGSSTVARCALATSVLGWIVVSSGGFPLGARVPFLSRVEASYHKLSPRRPAAAQSTPANR